jgi:NAD(P)-dependent dehydrogenase (short-subunit alcohol dehydrogenase family)
MQDLTTVRQMCDQMKADRRKFDVIINNAGALFSEAHSIEGIERTTVVDLIAPWTICCSLLGQIVSGGCIINVSSGGMYGSGLSISKLKNPDVPFSGSKAYAVAKRAMHVFSTGLNAEIEPQGIRVHCMHPGWADTPGIFNSLPIFHKITKRWLRTSFQGADTIVWLAMHNPQPGGKFWLDRRIQPSHILQSTQGKENGYKELRHFLDSFAKPNII